jgi:thiol-disulfide isomerase/thioredoxin
VDGLALLKTVEDPGMLAAGAPKLRARLEAQRDGLSLPYWRSLWDLEFRVAPKEAHEAVKRRVQADVEAWTKVRVLPTRDWYHLFTYASELTGDTTIRDWLEKTVAEQYPKSRLMALVDRARWSREHPRPPRTAKPDEYRAYSELEKKQLEALHAKYPNDPDVILDRWLYQARDTSRSLEGRRSIADAYAALQRRSPDFSWTSPPANVQLADYYVQWGVRLDQVRPLIQAGLRDAELETRYQAAPSMVPEEARSRQPDRIANTHFRALIVMADYYLLGKQLEQAQEVIRTGIANLQQRPIFPPGSPMAERDTGYRRSEWQKREARLAELAGRPPVSPADESQKAPTPLGLQFGPVLPGFETKDLDGRRWRTADLSGKITFVEVWASWCGPCRAEHPQIQQLHERLKGRNDLQLVTLSIDESAYLAESYMKSKGYSFPVIASKDVTEKLFPVIGLPQAWVVDRNGRRAPYYGGTRDPDRIIQELEKAK